MTTLKDQLREDLSLRLKMRRELGPIITKKIAFLGMEDLLLQRGAFFPFGQPLPPALMREEKQCFANAQGIAHGIDGGPPHGQWTYVEGYAMRAVLGIPVHHGWLVDETGTVTDPTWREIVPGEAVYCGLPIRHTYLRSHIRRCFKRGMWLSVLDNWEHGMPVLVGTHPINRVALPLRQFALAEKP